MIGLEDILYLYSGGTSNNDPSLSLGGEPSTVSISANRLFDELEESETTSGFVDYRCLYIANNNVTESLFNSRVFIKEQVPNGASVKIGFLIQNERQTVTVGGVYSGGSFTLSYNSNNFTVNYNADVNTWASNFQTVIRLITDLEDVEVTGVLSDTTTVFTVDFKGSAAQRWHPELEIISNDLTTFGESTLVINKAISGSPINAVASEIESETVKPSNITFYVTSPNSTISIGEFRGLDILPVWIERTVVAGTGAVTDDGFIIEMLGSPIV